MDILFSPSGVQVSSWHKVSGLKWFIPIRTASDTVISLVSLPYVERTYTVCFLDKVRSGEAFLFSLPDFPDNFFLLFFLLFNLRFLFFLFTNALNTLCSILESLSPARLARLREFYFYCPHTIAITMQRSERLTINPTINVTILISSSNTSRSLFSISCCTSASSIFLSITFARDTLFWIEWHGLQVYCRPSLYLLPFENWSNDLTIRHLVHILENIYWKLNITSKFFLYLLYRLC